MDSINRSFKFGRSKQRRVLVKFKTFVSLAAITAFGVVVPMSEIFARDWFVSQNRGKGKKGTIKKPSKDLGFIIKKLKVGDVVHIAQGTYLGKGKCGVYDIKVPVSVIGGYNDEFTKRDPWGEFQTVFSGFNKTKNWKQGARFRIDLTKYRRGDTHPIVVDGIIVDQGAQNRYKTDKEQMIKRMADPKTGKNPTPDGGAIRVSVNRNPMQNTKDPFWDITVRNCAVINSAPTQGVINVGGCQNTKVTIENNLLVNNTGSGIYAMGQFHGKDGFPVYEINNNTVLFTWKYDAMAQSFSGSSLKIDDDVIVNARNNVFAFADRMGILKKGAEPLLMLDNLVVGNVGCDYYEATEDMKMAIADVLDEAENLHEDSDEFCEEPIKPPVGEKYMNLYGSRVLIDRNAVEADIQAEKSNANALRGMLGLPLKAADIKGVEGDVWLPRLALENGMKSGVSKYHSKYGCVKPAAEDVSFAAKK